MAASGSISGTATLTITNPLVSIAVTTSSASVPVGYTQPFVATGTYADGTTSVINSIVTWASSNMAVATISNSAGTQGVVNRRHAGNDVDHCDVRVGHKPASHAHGEQRHCYVGRGIAREHLQFPWAISSSSPQPVPSTTGARMTSPTTFTGRRRTRPR